MKRVSPDRAPRAPAFDRKPLAAACGGLFSLPDRQPSTPRQQTHRFASMSALTHPALSGPCKKKSVSNMTTMRRSRAPRNTWGAAIAWIRDQAGLRLRSHRLSPSGGISKKQPKNPPKSRSKNACKCAFTISYTSFLMFERTIPGCKLPKTSRNAIQPSGAGRVQARFACTSPARSPRHRRATAPPEKTADPAIVSTRLRQISPYRGTGNYGKVFTVIVGEDL